MQANRLARALRDAFSTPIEITRSAWIVHGGVSLLLALAIATSAIGLLFYAIATTLLLLGSILLHEYAHAAAAEAQGVPVRAIKLGAHGGAASLAQHAAPRKMIVIAAAGPLASLTLAGAFHGAAHLGSPGADILSIMAGANLFVALANLLPIWPLDGGRILHAILALRYASEERALHTMVPIGIATGIVATVAAFLLAGPVLGVIAAGYGGAMIVVGMRADEHTTLRRALRDLPLADVAYRDRPVLRADATLTDAYAALARAQDPVLVSDAQQKIVGYVTLATATGASSLEGATSRSIVHLPPGAKAIDYLDSTAEVATLTIEGEPRVVTFALMWYHARLAQARATHVVIRSAGTREDPRACT